MEILIFFLVYLVLYILVKMIIIDHWLITPVIALVWVLFLFKPLNFIDDGIVVTPNVIETEK